MTKHVPAQEVEPIRTRRSSGVVARRALIGRQRELLDLDQYLESVGGEHPAPVLIELTGPAGIGKTAVLGEFIRRARGTGSVVLIGGADTDGPLGMWQEIVDGHDAGGAGARPLPAGGRDPADVVRELAGQARGQRIVLVLDDLHLAGPASLAVLADLLRKPVAARFMIVLSYRDRQVSARLRETIATRSGRISGRHLAVGPLSRRSIDQLLAGPETDAWRQRLYVQSGGNPSYALTLAAEQRPAPVGGCGRFEEQARILGELDRLEAPVRTLLEAAAVIGDEFDVQTLAGILGDSDVELFRTIDDLIAHDVLSPTLSGQYFTFRHPVVRRAARDACDLGRRAEFHRRADATLRARGASALQRAPHVEWIARHGDLDAVGVLVAAARSGAGTDPPTTVSWLITALRILPDTAENQARRASLMVDLAVAEGMGGHLHRCRDRMHEALRLLSAESVDEHAQAVSFIGLVQRLLGAHAETGAMLRAELAAIGDRHVPAGTRLLVELAGNELCHGRTAECATHAERACRSAALHGQESLRVAGLGLLGAAAALDGRVVEALEHVTSAVAALDRMIDGEFAGNLHGVFWVGWAEVLVEQWDGALRHFDRAVELAERTDQWLILPHLLVGRVVTLRNRDRLVEARTVADRALAIAHQSGIPDQIALCYAMLAWTDACLGDQVRAEEWAVAALDHGAQRAGWWRGLQLLMIAEVYARTGNAAQCRWLYEAADDPSYRLDRCQRVAWFELLTRAELNAGRTQAARSWAARARRHARRPGPPGHRALADLAVAEFAAASGAGVAAQLARCAARVFEERSMTFDARRARELVQSRPVVPDAPDAPDAARQPAGPARPVAGCAAREVVRSAASDVATGSLTRREQQVAALVGDGMTNRLIARRLNIAEKTVEMHLSRVFDKVGVPNRAGLAAFVVRPQASSG